MRSYAQHKPFSFMKRILNNTLCYLHRYYPLAAGLVLTLLPLKSVAVPAELLFEDHFDQGIPGWTAVQRPRSRCLKP